MRHNNKGRKFSRTPAHRKVLMQNLSRALLIHGRIKTTLFKAKDMRRVLEPLITLAQRDDLHARRQAYKVLQNHQLVKKLFDQIGPLFKGIAGGYTRILKLADNRRGDNAPMAIIELTHRLAEEDKPAKTKKNKKEAKVEAVTA